MIEARMTQAERRERESYEASRGRSNDLPHRCAETRLSAPDSVPRFSITVTGKGRPMLLIPGLTNGGAVWDGTVDALKREYELYATDLRDSLATVTTPVLNLHAWVAYQGYGMTRPRADSMFASQ